MFCYPKCCPNCNSKRFKLIDRQKGVQHPFRVIGGTAYFKCSKCKHMFSEVGAFHSERAKVPFHIKDVNPKDKKQVDAFFKQEIKRMKANRCPTCGGVIKHRKRLKPL